jgi:hypothetical protein
MRPETSAKTHRSISASLSTVDNLRDFIADSFCLPLCSISMMLIDLEPPPAAPRLVPVLAAGEIGAKYEFESPGIDTLGSFRSFRRLLMMVSSWTEERRLSEVLLVSAENHLLKRDLALVSPSPPTPFCNRSITTRKTTFPTTHREQPRQAGDRVRLQDVFKNVRLIVEALLRVLFTFAVAVTAARRFRIVRRADRRLGRRTLVALCGPVSCLRGRCRSATGTAFDADLVLLLGHARHLSLLPEPVAGPFRLRRRHLLLAQTLRLLEASQFDGVVLRRRAPREPLGLLIATLTCHKIKSNFIKKTKPCPSVKCQNMTVANFIMENVVCQQFQLNSCRKKC